MIINHGNYILMKLTSKIIYCCKNINERETHIACMTINCYIFNINCNHNAYIICLKKGQIFLSQLIRCFLYSDIADFIDLLNKILGIVKNIKNRSYMKPNQRFCAMTYGQLIVQNKTKRCFDIRISFLPFLFLIVVEMIKTPPAKKCESLFQFYRYLI